MILDNELECQWPAWPGELPCRMNEPCAHEMVGPERTRIFAAALLFGQLAPATLKMAF